MIGPVHMHRKHAGEVFSSVAFFLVPEAVTITETEHMRVLYWLSAVDSEYACYFREEQGFYFPLRGFTLIAQMFETGENT